MYRLNKGLVLLLAIALVCSFAIGIPVKATTYYTVTFSFAGSGWDFGWAWVWDTAGIIPGPPNWYFAWYYGQQFTFQLPAGDTIYLSAQWDSQYSYWMYYYIQGIESGYWYKTNFQTGVDSSFSATLYFGAY